MPDEEINLEEDEQEVKPVVKPKSSKKSWKPKQPENKEVVLKINPIITVGNPHSLENNEEKIQRLLNELFTCSLNERRQMILQKYQNEMREFKEKLGKNEFEKVLGEFMREQIEGKVLAAYHSVD